MSQIVLELKGISKTFPGVKALNEMQLQVYAGEVHALMGENGAGKSTLMNIINGSYQGRIFNACGKGQNEKSESCQRPAFISLCRVTA